MKVVKSKKFKDAYILKELGLENKKRCGVLEHVFLKDAAYKSGKMEVQYVCYSRYYKKWIQDTMYMSKEKYENVLLLANLV